MKIFTNPIESSWAEIIKRPTIDHQTIIKDVQNIIEKVVNNGDKALFDFANKFDSSELDNLEVSEFDINSSENLVKKQLKEAILKAKENIEKFHLAQKQSDIFVETIPGVKCWQKSVAIDSVGLYIPGGTAPLFSTILMLAIPAKIAGCKNIIMCTPAKHNQINPIMLYTAKLCGVNSIFQIGGAQAIAAMAHGTETIPKVNKIFGPGNQYVTVAKQLVNTTGTAIDLPAGPTELAVLADETANPKFIAADLLSQLEHGLDSQVVFVTTEKKLIDQTLKEIESQIKEIDRKSFIESSFKNSKAIYFKDINLAIKFINQYAAEHLIIATKDYHEISSQITSAGSIFLGNYSPESAGDYCSGTNHTLPTNGNAVAYSGVNLDSFVKKITYQEISKEGIYKLSTTIELMANAEGLSGHANAAKIRTEK